MAYGVKYRLTFTDRLSNSIQLDIEQDGYSGSITTVEGGADPLKPRLDGEETTHDPIKSTGYEISFFVDTHGDYAEFLDCDDRDYRVKIYEDAALVWIGWMLSETVSEPIETGKYEINLVAKDGLRNLRNVEYTPDGRKSHIEIVAECLQEADHQIDINVAIGFNHKSETGQPLEYTYVNTEIFRENNAENKKCYDVLVDILELYGASVMQQAGEWFIIREDEKYDGSFSGKTYDYTGTYSTTFSLTDSKTIAETSDSSNVNLLSGSTLNKISAFREAWIKQVYGKSLNSTIVNGNFNEWTSSTVLKNWTYAGSVATLRYDKGDGDYYPKISGYGGLTTKYIYQSVEVEADNTNNYIFKYDYGIMGASGTGTFQIQVTVEYLGTTYYLYVDTDGYGHFASGVASAYQVIQHTNIDANPYTDIKWFTNEIEIVDTFGTILPAGTLYVRVMQAGGSGATVAGGVVDNVTFYPKNMPEENSTVYLYGQNNPYFNFVPERIETTMGDVPDVSNASLYYKNYLSTDATGETPTSAWNLSGDITDYLINEVRLRSLLNANSKNLTVKQLFIEGQINPLTRLVDHNGTNFKICSYTGSLKNNTFEVVAIEMVEPETNVPTITETEYPNDPDETNYFTGEGESSTSISIDINTILNSALPRANEETLTAGSTDIEFLQYFPGNVSYVLRTYCFDANNYMVAHEVTANNQLGFTVNATRDCTLIYLAIPKK